MSPASPPKALTLDIWYTLLYQTRGQRERYEVARWRAWSDPLAEAGVGSNAARRSIRTLFAEAKRRDARGRSFSVDSQVAWLRTQTGAPLSLTAVSSGLDRAVDQAECRVATGAFEMIDRMNSAGIRLALVSNVLYENPRPIRRLLDRTGLGRAVPEVVLSCEVGATKPSPRPLRIALGRLRTPARDALHIGDRPGDIASAWRAGGSAVRFTGLRRFRPDGHRRRWPARFRGTPQLPAWGRLTEATVGQWWEAARAARRPRPDTSGQGSA